MRVLEKCFKNCVWRLTVHLAKVPFPEAVADSQAFGICFLPLFIMDILKDACVRYHCPKGPEMLEYFSSP